MVSTAQNTWQALSDPTRRELLDLLRAGPRTTGELCEPFEVSRYAVMKHLAVLERAELIRVYRRGRQRFNELNAAPLKSAVDAWIQHYKAYWNTNLHQLKQHIESDIAARAQSKTKSGEKQMAQGTATDCGFINIEMEIKIKASPDRVFDAITSEIDKWWAYRVCKNAPMKLDATPGGLFIESDGKGNGLVWGRVLQIERPKIIRIEEPMGNMPLPRSGAHIYKLTADGEHTIVKLTCQQMGQLSEKDKACLESGWKELIDTHLRKWIEDGVACEKMVDDCG
ncbi:MAG: hypothetical protein DHS20C16_05940 [Phycisphaerae bacterium]|nr:MAG: hypothetical protein DHS20C16_05940 [Phycisphaerae bacterium]